MKRQQGFGMIAAIVVLVILATMAAAVVSIGTTQQITSAQGVISAKAWNAARAGNEWGLYKALKKADWAGVSTSCDTGSRTASLDLTTDTGFQVTVSCASWQYQEGESAPGIPQTVRIYRIAAVACPVAPCPSTNAATVSGLGYVERSRVVLATD